MTDQEIKSYLSKLALNQIKFNKALKKLKKHYKDLEFQTTTNSTEIGHVIMGIDEFVKCQAGDKVVNETPLTDLNSKVQAAINAKDLVNKLEEFTNGWSMSYLGSYNFNSGFKQIQATKAAIEAIQFILDNDLTRSEMEAIKKELNDMA
jgi:hypothetical protein